MSLKKDESGKRWVQVEVEVPGTPEQVWDAIATGPGVSSWFVPTEMRDDGSVVCKFGPGMESVARQTAWDPPHRFAAEAEMGPNAPKLATEWIVEAKSGSTCVVRVVHSLFATTDDWDNQLENIEGGWPDYFRILHLYLTHFNAMPCSAFQLMTFASEPASAVWETLTGPLGLAGAVVGERRTSPEGAPPLSGVVERAGGPGHPNQLMLRLDAPAPGVCHLFTMPMGGPVIVLLRFYLYGADAAEVVSVQEPAWNQWLSQQFKQPEAPAIPCGDS